MRRNHRAVAVDHAPVHSAVVVALEIPDRDPLKVGAAHIAAHRADETVPAPLRLKICRCRDVGRVFGKRVELMKKALQGLEEFGLLRQRKPGWC